MTTKSMRPINRQRKEQTQTRAWWNSHFCTKLTLLVANYKLTIDIWSFISCDLSSLALQKHLRLYFSCIERLVGQALCLSLDPLDDHILQLASMTPYILQYVFQCKYNSLLLVFR